jgi:TolB-like protein/Flp pilus assembly protein TadD
MAGGRVFTLNLLESFRLTSPEGARLDIVSKKGMALLAMLAMASEGERTRAWLQDRLWGTRERTQAQSSLRRELSNLRKCLNGAATPPALVCEHHWVRLDLAQFDIDARPSGGAQPTTAEFLEGFDIAGEEGFEEWLREQRRVLASRRADSTEAKPQPTEAKQPTNALLNLSLSAARFDDRPALAVLPFANLTDDDINDYICEGLSEDLIDRLSRLRWLPVIARNSSFAFTPDKADPRQVGQNLGAKYVLEGRLRAGGRNFSIALNLSDTTTGAIFWSHRLPLPPQRSQDALDPLVAALVSVLDAQIDYAEQVRARGKRQNHLEFNDLIWRGRWHLNRLTRADGDMARNLFAEALELEPTSPEALIQATFSLGWTLWAQRGGDAEIAEMRKLAQRAIIADPDDGRGHMLAGIAEMWRRQPARAQTLLQRAIELNPSLVHAHGQLGCYHNLVGEPAAAIAPLRMAQRLSPNDIHVFFVIGELAMAYGMSGQWAEAVELADQSLTRRPAYWYAHVVKINALARSGDARAAKHGLDELLTLKPDFTKRYVEWIPFIDQRWNKALVEGLALAAGPPATTPKRMLKKPPKKAHKRPRPAAGPAPA